MEFAKIEDFVDWYEWLLSKGCVRLGNLDLDLKIWILIRISNRTQNPKTDFATDFVN